MKQLFAFLIVFSSYALYGQKTLEEFMKEKEDFTARREEEFNKFAKEREEYINKIDKEYSDYLRMQWEKYIGFAAESVAEKPKPKVQPVAKEIIKTDDTITYEVSRTRTPADLDLPVLQKSEPDTFKRVSIKFEYYGTPIILEYHRNFLTSLPAVINEQSISASWDAMNKTYYNHFINQLLQVKSLYNLNDWGYYLLIKAAAEKISSDAGCAVFIQWFMLTKSNYIAKTGYKDNHLYLLLPFRTEIYGIPFITLNNMRYYIMGTKEKTEVYTYKKDFPEARNIIDLTLTSSPNLTIDIRDRILSFEGINFAVKYNENNRRFYNDYPQTDLKVYLTSSAPSFTKESVAEGLAPIIKNLNPVDAVSLLLKFVQETFDYKTDIEQFKAEKFFFPEESFMYPYSDCEDRAALLSWLIREFTGQEILAVEYTGHVSLAINLGQDVKGDHFIFKGKRFIISDPTFKGAPLGVTMPQYKNEKARLIDITTNDSRRAIEETVWKKIGDAGGHHGSNSTDIVFDATGNSYVTGYFSGIVQFGTTRLISFDSTRDAFIAGFDKDANNLWAIKISGPGNEIGFQIMIDPEQNLFVAGSFDSIIKAGDGFMKAGQKGDIYIIKLNRRGEIIWSNRAKTDNLSRENNDVFVACYSYEGQHQYTRIYGETENFSRYGIDYDMKGNIYLTGAVFAPGLNIKELAYERMEDFNPVTSLKEQNDKLIAAQYNPTLAGLFAVINLINYSGMSLPGKVAQDALDKYNPSFKKRYGSIYENIGKITFLKNAKGIVIITTNSGGAVNFPSMKITHNSKIKISSFNTGNAQIDILEGVSVGKGYIWYNLNYIKLFKNSDYIIFDYDQDHTQKKIKLGEILQ